MGDLGKPRGVFFAHFPFSMVKSNMKKKSFSIYIFFSFSSIFRVNKAFIKYRL